MTEWVEWKDWREAKPVTRRGPHQFTKRVLHWPYCARCGLVRLKNDATRIAEKKQCQWEDDK